ncbi:hypothetical protein M3Y94_01297600 [Aphelenchoides besseyi]|nr:hypothetical protein M3Y94_01297600 [Aphelenchoides besseyi]
MTSILSSIQKIRDENSYRPAKIQHASLLLNHQCELDDCDRKIYISAEVRPDCLDRGLEMTSIARRYVSRDGHPKDRALRMIGKSLGGPEHHFNFFPVNPKVDLTVWKENETKIYEHVKKGGNRHALMVFAIEYDDESQNEILRPIKIYYHFTLYENDEIVGDVMEGVIDNPVPKWV